MRLARSIIGSSISALTTASCALAGTVANAPAEPPVARVARPGRYTPGGERRTPGPGIEHPVRGVRLEDARELEADDGDELIRVPNPVAAPPEVAELLQG